MLLALGVVVVIAAFLTFGRQAAFMPAPERPAEKAETNVPPPVETAEVLEEEPPVRPEDEGPTTTEPKFESPGTAWHKLPKIAADKAMRKKNGKPPTAFPTEPPSPPSNRYDMPAFPWPPPRASALHDIPLAWLVDQVATARLRDLDSRLTAALDRVGYGQRSYLWVPGGYALSTRVERIAPDGTPQAGAERWAIDEGAAPIFSLVDYLRALFLARPGRFRVLVFTVTPVSFAATGPPVTASEATAWVTSGVARLPAPLGEVELASAPFACTALVYEFERAADTDPARVVVPGRLDARQHLERAGLWKELAHGS